MIIVCIGDSITYGQLLDPSLAWPALIRGHEIIAKGVPGDTTRLGLERFPRDVQEAGATAVIIQFGHNDANRWVTDRGLPRVSKEAFRANLSEMVTRVREFGAFPFLCTMTPTRRSVEHADDCVEYNAVIHDVAVARSVSLIDVRAAFVEWDLLLEDGLHLSEVGHRVYAVVVQEALDSRRPR